MCPGDKGNLTSPDQLFAVKEKLESTGIAIAEASLQMIPKTQIDCSDEDLKANLELIDYLEALEDVDTVYHNLVRED